MGLLRLLNPLALHPTAPRHRTARAAEEIARLARREARSVPVAAPVAPKRRIDEDVVRACLAEADALRARLAADPASVTNDEIEAVRARLRKASS